MLKLERMEMIGFKSFGDRTEVVFPDGITAVVGPNGCGKSNIGDAINWVLGEQSAKMLRGASMEDVIFNGSEKRKAMGMAEVSLFLAGENGSAERRDVVLTRRLFRDGNSEYLMNGQRARLKDIQEALREAHVGAKTYATIEQGRIEQILNAKPKDRRLIIEEAAGIAGYKQKRRLTELKLDATQANLLRVNDILAEVRRQINALKRQAAKARRYQRLRDELRAKEAVRFGLKARDTEARLSASRAEEDRARDAEAAAAAHLATLEAALAAERVALEDAARLLQERRDALHRAGLQLNEEEALARQCRERISEGEESETRLRVDAAALSIRGDELENEERTHAAFESELRDGLAELTARLTSISAAFEDAERNLGLAREESDRCRRGLFESMNQVADARNRDRTLEETSERNRVARDRRVIERDSAHGDLERLAQESARLAADVARQRELFRALEEEHTGSEGRWSANRDRLAAENDMLLQLRARETASAAQLRTLEDVATRFAGVSEGVRVLLSSGPAAGVRTHGVVADFVEAGAEVEVAAEAYLQALLPAVILEDDGDAQGAAQLLRAQGSGRTLFLSKTHPVGEPAVGSPSNGHFPLPAHVLDDRRVLGRLRDRIRLKGANGFLDDRIGDAVLVDTLESALALHREHPQADYLTATGEVVYASGVVAAGGVKAAEQGLLAHTRRIHETRLENAEAQAQLALSQERADQLRAESARLEAEVTQLRNQLEDARRRQMELELHVERSGDEHHRTGRTAEMLAAELAQLDDEARSLETERAASRAAVAEGERRHAALESELSTRLNGQERLEVEIRRLSEEIGGLRAEAAGRTQSLVAAERERERRSAERRDVAGRLTAATDGAAAARQRVHAAAGMLRANEERRVGLIEAHEDLAAGVARGETEQEERRRALAEREGALREARAAVDSARDALRVAELARAGAEADRRHLDELCLQELAITAAEAVERAGAALDEATPAALDEGIALIRERIDAIGPVNMTAIAEFTELEQRHAFLDTQRQDLESSITSLRETIRRINSSTRERFVDAFESIRGSFQEIFQLLFGGGRADLRLEEGEDILECGIEIVAQPPGKKLGNIQLLSGGEKSMSAIALLFAIFRYQPSPFCLLDEVDAALDELNVNRFTRMLREYAASTRFILITHNKLSMDSANLLYGVTMDEPGVSRLVSLKLEA